MATRDRYGGPLSVTDGSHCIVGFIRALLSKHKFLLQIPIETWSVCFISHTSYLIHIYIFKIFYDEDEVIKFLGENPGACPWDEAKKYFSKSLMSISSEYTL